MVNLVTLQQSPQQSSVTRPTSQMAMTSSPPTPPPFCHDDPSIIPMLFPGTGSENVNVDTMSSCFQ